MPRHLISDSHERINEIPTVPICIPVKLQVGERASFKFRTARRPCWGWL